MKKKASLLGWKCAQTRDDDLVVVVAVGSVPVLLPQFSKIVLYCILTLSRRIRPVDTAVDIQSNRLVQSVCAVQRGLYP